MSLHCRPIRIVARPRCCCTTTSTAVCGPATIVELAARDRLHGAARRRTPAELGAWFREAADSGSLERYLETFAHTVAVMQTREALVRVARECAEDLAADGVVYAEVRYAPEQHTERRA